MGGRVRVGNQTALSASPLTGPFDYAVSSGFDAFEWFPDDWDVEAVDHRRRRYIRQTARDRDIAMSVHAPWWADPGKEAGLGQIRRSIEFAGDIGALLLNIHLYADRGLDAYIEALLPVMEETARAGLGLSIENTPMDGPEEFNRLFSRLRGLNSSSHVGMCLDLGHANLCAETRNDFIGYIDRLSPSVPVIHVHLHENYGDEDSHLTLFTGPAAKDPSGVEAFVQRMKRRGFAGSIILEQWPEPASLLREARDRLLEMFGDFGRQAAETHPKAALKGHKKAAKKKEPRARRLPEKTGLKETATGYEAGQAAAGPEGDFASVLSAEDPSHGSWRQKLMLVNELLSRGRPDMGDLAYLSIYLRFIASGALACAEDERHFRPSHHARLAARIEKRLSELETPENALVTRKIYPYLPSHDSAFLRAEPLTRIRDIAHRNDIPRQLKDEIKHTLQNKLHRCAGPEDLATSEALLRRVTAPGAGYPPAFVREFEIFHRQLREFFNASSLEERLRGLADTRKGTGLAHLVSKFLKQKEGDAPPETVAALDVLTALRGSILKALEEAEEEAAQDLRLSDIGLEDLAFVLLSRLVNEIDFSGRGKIPWSGALRALGLSVANLRLGGTEAGECLAIEAELRAVEGEFDAARRESLLRLGASLKRCRRLAENYSARVLSLYPERVEKLGRALGVSGQTISSFAEGEVRGSVAFQLSRLASGLLEAVRALAGLPRWDALVTGEARGRLARAERLGDLRAASGEPLIALVGRVEGDEELPEALGGIILGQELPHLSHLAMRARQAGVVLASCEEAGELERLAALEGKAVEVRVTPDAVSVKPSRGVTKAVRAGAVSVPEADLRPARSILALEEASMNNAGPKAEALRRLAGLSELEPDAGYPAGYRVPPALAIPFGVMEEALEQAGRGGEYETLLRKLDAPGAEDLDGTLEKLRRLIEELPFPGEAAKEVAERFAGDESLVVRSSSNCEDLPGLSGAGLYDTVLDVRPSAVSGAVRKVWASLFTRRAAAQWRQAGIPHRKAHMAAVIQRMLVPDYSFIMFTSNPLAPDSPGGRAGTYVELVAGMGETLASAAEAGGPYRMAVDRRTGEVSVLAFSSMSHALLRGDTREGGGLARTIIDYSVERLSNDGRYRDALLRRLSAVGAFVENAFGEAQDIEGAVAGEEIYLFQSRHARGRAGNDPEEGK
jgi:phosphoglucan,water dikinase